LIILGLAPVGRGDDRAGRLYQAAQRAERAGNALNAYLLYSQAAALEPANAAYAFRKNALEARALLTSQIQPEPEPAGASRSRVLVPIEELSPLEMQQAREAAPPPRLEGSDARHTFDLRGDARMIFEEVAAAYGISVVFEPDYQSPPPFRFQVSSLTMEDAFRTLEAVSNSCLAPIADRVALVARDTPQRRADTVPVMAAAIPIPERMSVQEAQEIVTAVQQTMEIRRIVVDPRWRVVFLRDQVSKVTAARQIFAELSRLRAQVHVEVELLSLSESSSLRYGLALPTSWPVLNFGSFLHNMPPVLSGVSGFLAFGGGATFMGIGITDASLFASASRSSASSVLSSQVVAVDGLAATLHVGDRYPIVTAGYYGNTSGSGEVFTPPPTVNFVDLGMVLKITPTVHEDGEITLEVDAQNNVLGADGGNGIPIISSRKYQGKARMRSGEWAVIAGLLRVTTDETRVGIAGLSELPLVGRLFRQNTTSQETVETLLVLKPRIVNLPPWETPAPAVWIGSESKPATAF
jgi:general secretion pathway protein D